MEDSRYRGLCRSKGRCVKVEVVQYEHASRRWLILVGTPVIFVVAYFYKFLPVAGMSFCVINVFTGLPCPGCGLMRSFQYLVHGYISQSLKAHIMGIPIAILFVYLFVRQFVAEMLKKNLPNLFNRYQRCIIQQIGVIVFILHWFYKLAVCLLS